MDYDRRRIAGDSKLEAIRALRRRISDEGCRWIRHEEHLRATAQAPLATAA